MQSEIEVSRAAYNDVLPRLTSGFRQFEQAVPEPQLVYVGGRRAFRYVERLPQQAIVLKLSRLVTGLEAVWALLERGLPQEAAAIQRILDEIGSDIMFLAGPLTVGKKEPIHDAYLTDFFEEEFHVSDPVGTQVPRHRVPRKKIRAYVARTYGAVDEPIDKAIAVAAFIEGAYSGYIHVAGAQAMDAYGGIPRRFHIEGMQGTPILDDAAADFRNYLFRGLTDMACGARALGLIKLFDELRVKSDEFAAAFQLHPND